MPSDKYQNPETIRAYDDFDGDHRDQRSWTMWMSLWLAQACRASRSGAVICLFTDWRMLPATTDALQAGGWMWRGIAPWDKTGAARNQLGRFKAQCEYVVWGSKGPMPLDRLDGCKRRTLPGLFTHRVDPAEKQHVTAKPLALMDDVVEICAPGSLVLEPFAGSGTTGLAAVRAGHRVLMAEQVQAYADITRRRMAGAAARPGREQLSLLPTAL